MTSEQQIQELREIEAMGTIFINRTIKMRIKLEKDHIKPVKKSALCDSMRAKIRSNVYKANFNRKTEAA